MSIEEIRKRVHSYLLQAQADPTIDIETNKIDFKYEWYNLKDDAGINEFLKDTTAIANSYGGSDGFIIIGYNKKLGLKDASFKDSQLRDKTDLAGLIGKRVDRTFNIDEIPMEYNGSKISVLHIPPSLDKPHVIRRYQSEKSEYPNEIFVRHASGAKTATKHDLDLMYAEKKSIIVDRQVNASLNLHALRFFMQTPKISSITSIILENVGMRPLGIQDITLTLKVLYNREWITPIFSGSSSRVLESNAFWPLTDKLLSGYLGSVETQQFVEHLNNYRKDPAIFSIESVKLTLYNGEMFPANLYVVK